MHALCAPCERLSPKARIRSVQHVNFQPLKTALPCSCEYDSDRRTGLCRTQIATRHYTQRRLLSGGNLPTGSQVKRTIRRSKDAFPRRMRATESSADISIRATTLTNRTGRKDLRRGFRRPRRTMVRPRFFGRTFVRPELQRPCALTSISDQSAVSQASQPNVRPESQQRPNARHFYLIRGAGLRRLRSSAGRIMEKWRQKGVTK